MNQDDSKTGDQTLQKPPFSTSPGAPTGAQEPVPPAPPATGTPATARPGEAVARTSQRLTSLPTEIVRAAAHAEKLLADNQVAERGGGRFALELRTLVAAIRQADGR